MRNDLSAEIREIQAQIGDLCHQRAVIRADLEAQIAELRGQAADLRAQLGDRDRAIDALLAELREASTGHAVHVPPVPARRPRLRLIQGAIAAAMLLSPGAAAVPALAAPAPAPRRPVAMHHPARSRSHPELVHGTPSPVIRDRDDGDGV